MTFVEPGVIGQKRVAEGGIVATSQHPSVTDVMLDTVKAGGTAADAVVAGALTQATIQQEMTNHAGTVSFLYWDNINKKLHDLNSLGTLVPELPELHPVPGGHGMYAPAGTRGPMAVIPGFIPGLAALHGRFGKLRWESLVEPAIRWADEGSVVTSFEHLVQAQTVDFFLYTASGRDHFLPGGHLPQVGDRWPKPELAATLRGLAKEGPDYFTSGPWAQAFVERAHSLGWDIGLEHMTKNPPRWGSGQAFTWRGHDIVQLSAPERQAPYSAITLGVFDALGGESLGHYTEDPEAAWALGHALRIADRMTAFLNDPAVFESPMDTLLDPGFHASLANLVRGQKTAADLTQHVTLTHGPNAMSAARISKQPAGSCELTVVDRDGNWVQLMNTLQSGGIPGEVVGGVPMVGSHSIPSLAGSMSHWNTPALRIKCILACTMVLEDGEPWWSLGSPGNVHCTAPQVLLNGLGGYGKTPDEAEDAPRMIPLDDSYVLGIEDRVSPTLGAGLATKGILLSSLPPYDYHMGTYQMAWRDGDRFKAYTGARRAGKAAGC